MDYSASVIATLMGLGRRGIKALVFYVLMLGLVVFVGGPIFNFVVLNFVPLFLIFIGIAVLVTVGLLYDDRERARKRETFLNEQGW